MPRYLLYIHKAQDPAAPSQPSPQPFYTHAEKIVSRLGKQTRPDQVAGMVRDLSEDERKWTGVDEHIARAKQQGVPVNRDELLSTIRQKTPKIETAMLGGAEAEKKLDWHPASSHEVYRTFENFRNALDADGSEYHIGYGEGNTPVAAVYRHPANERYVALLQNPEDPDARHSSGNIATLEAAQHHVHGWRNQNAGIAPIYDSYALKGGENYRELLLKTPETGGSDYQSGHWHDHPNVLAHVRMKDRTDNEGKRLLHLEEVQSDWHQAGRDEGYNTPEHYSSVMSSLQNQFDEKHEEAQRLNKELDTAYQASLPVADSSDHPLAQKVLALWQQRDQSNKEKESLRLKMDGLHRRLAPDAPFKGDHWQQLALKHALQIAAEGGYDGLSWNPSHIQNGEINSPENVSDGQRLNYDQKIPQWLNKYAKRFGVSAGTTSIPHPDAGKWDVMNHDGDVVSSHGDYEMAKHHADRSGHWVQRRSDKDTIDVHHLPITPEMRQSILNEGHPLWGLPMALSKAFVLLRGDLSKSQTHRRAS